MILKKLRWAGLVVGMLGQMAFADLDTLAPVEIEDSVQGWVSDVSASLAVNQSGTKNWSAGGDDSWAWTARLHGDWARRWGDQREWGVEEQLDLVYGRTQLGDGKPQKTMDQIFAETLLDRSIWKKLRGYGLLRFESQFTDGFVYSDTAEPVQVSAGWDPAILTEGMGIGHPWQTPGQSVELLARFGGAFRQTFSSTWGWADDEATAKRETVRNEKGFETLLRLKIQWNEILSLQSKFTAFSDLKGVQRIDMRWESLLNAKVSDYLSFQATLDGLYDTDQSLSTQWREAIAVVWSIKLMD